MHANEHEEESRTADERRFTQMRGGRECPRKGTANGSAYAKPTARPAAKKENLTQKRLFGRPAMIDPEIFTNVQRALTAIERGEAIRVLYACESGSRAWGFASGDSDYDVRFIYVHPRDHYLSVFANRDVIEQKITDDLDISGWDLRKTLGLVSKSNPPLLEWFKSPIVYRQDPEFVGAFRSLMDQFYSPKRCFAHYLHMGAGNWRRYIEGREWGDNLK
jgi:hypothetical protein